jgi:hypothetical protein
MEDAIKKMQEALDTMVAEALKNKSIWLADAIDHLATAIDYAKTGTE